MTDSIDPTRTKRPSSIPIASDSPLKYAFDGGLLSGASPLDDTPESIEFEADDDQESDQSTESDSETESMVDLDASFRIFSESILKLEMAELKLIKEKERLRFEAEKRRIELETQLTQMMMQTQLQIASLVCQKSSNRKRKRSEDAKFGASERRDCAILMGLLPSSLISGLDSMK